MLIFWSRQTKQLLAYEIEVIKLYEADVQERNKDLNSMVKEIFHKAQELNFQNLPEKLVSTSFSMVSSLDSHIGPHCFSPLPHTVDQ